MSGNKNGRSFHHTRTNFQLIFCRFERTDASKPDFEISLCILKTLQMLQRQCIMYSTERCQAKLCLGDRSEVRVGSVGKSFLELAKKSLKTMQIVQIGN